MVRIMYWTVPYLFYVTAYGQYRPGLGRCGRSIQASIGTKPYTKLAWPYEGRTFLSLGRLGDFKNNSTHHFILLLLGSTFQWPVCLVHLR
jgi:hypothetical protein